MTKGLPYLRSKVMLPSTPRASVSRPRPERLLDAGLAGRLILVDAPPGWGKTTVVARWLQSQDDHGRAWLSLDPEDDDPARFWAYVIEAIRSGRPRFGEWARSALHPSGQAPTAELLPALLRDLDDLPGDGMVLVLDDYHLVRSPHIHAGVIFLIEHLTPRDHLVVITRADPPFPLPRWRVRGDVTEIRVDDLRFDTVDTGRLLHQVLDVPLESWCVDRLQARTEGWVAGLLLAAISMRTRPDPALFVEGFAGDDRHIVDYLGSEVLDSLDQPTRRFLARTSILDRLSGSLCDAVTQTCGSGQVLAHLEGSNLFVTALDSRGEWFRYHQLFAELLRVELHRTEASQVAALHTRAGQWYLENGLVSEAIRHAVAGGDIAGAADLLAQRWSELLQRGDLAAVTQALDRLGDETVRADPRLCLVRAWMTINLGQVSELAEWIEAAESALTGWPGRDAVAFGAAAGMLRCIEEYLTGDAGAAIVAARRALDVDAVQLPPWRSVGCPVLGIALYWSGQVDESKSTLEPAIRRARDAGNFLAQLHGTGCLALAAAVAHEHAGAAELVDRATTIRSRHGFDLHWAGAMTLLARGRLALAAGDLNGAEASIAEAVDLSRRGLARIELAYGLLELAAIQLQQGRRGAAAAAVAEAQEALAHCPDAGAVAQLAAELAKKVGPHHHSPVPRHLYADKLSPREAAVLVLLPSDLSLRDIAASLCVSPNTVKTQTRAIYRKLGATNRAEAVSRAQALGLA